MRPADQPVTVAVIEEEIAERQVRSRLRALRRRSVAIAAGLAVAGALVAIALVPARDGGEDPPEVVTTTRLEAEETVPGRSEPGTITIPHYDPVP